MAEVTTNSPPPRAGEGQGGGAGLMEKLVSLAKRRGFFYQSSEIYGGIQGVYDFGPQSIFSPLQIHPTSVFRTPPASVSIAQHPPKLDVSGLC